MPKFTAGGRIVTENGLGVRNAIVTMISGTGTQTVLTRSFGNFRLDNITPGDTIILSVKSKRFRFLPQMLVVTLNNTRNDISFTRIE